ncbi:MAG TPA: flagellar filament capping protein FliD [Rhodocyclaceae bacterium]
MDIGTLVSTQLQFAQLSQSTSTRTTTQVGDLTAPAAQRIGRQFESTNVQLSAYGQIKSAFAGAQTAATALGTSATSKTAPSADIVKAAQAFVDSYNLAVKTVSGATANSASQPGALASDLRARAAATDLARSVTSGNALASLKQAGIALNRNGTLTLDTKALQQALQSSGTQTKGALASLAGQVGGAAGRELAGTGNVGISVARLTSRAQALAGQQSALQQQAASVQSTLDRQGATLNYATANGLAAYQRLMG